MALSDLNTPISYGDYIFSPHVETTALDGTFVYDAARRTVVYTTWTITLRDKIGAAPGSTLDAAIEDARLQLSRPGDVLIYQNKGFGNLTINQAGKRDIKWGPTPKGFRYRILGRDLAGEITWTVEVSVPEMCLDPLYQAALLASNYTVSYQVDQFGYTRRMISGYVELALTRQTVEARNVPDDVDRFWDGLLIFDPPPGFRIGNRNRDLSEDKRVMRFSVEHLETGPMPYQPNVVEADVSHRLSTEQGNLRKWTGVISASYTMDRNIERAQAVFTFLQMALARMGFTQNTVQNVIPVGFTIEEVPYALQNHVRLSLAYTFTTSLATQSAPALILNGLNASALFTPIAGSNYNAWKASLQQGAFAPRGFQGLRHQASEDVILDLCGNQRAVVADAGGVIPNVGPFLGQIASVLPPPAPEKSWMDHACSLVINALPNLVALKPLPQTAIGGGLLTGTTLEDLLQRQLNLNGSMPVIGGQLVNNISDVIQQRATPTVEAWLVGHGVRAGYLIPPPQISSVAGEPVIPAGGSFVQKTIGNYGVPIVGAMWALKFLVPSIGVGSLPIPPNPSLGIPQQGD